jgi:beta-glucanase (GH16 family)
MRILTFFLFHVFSIANVLAIENAVYSDTAKYTLIWSDEFDKDGSPDTSKWRFETGFVRNEEAQWYQAENAICIGGNLVITGKKEDRPNPTYVDKSDNWRTNREFIKYSGASLVMKKEHAFQYGKVEVRAKIEAQTGLWPAIWTLGVKGQWPSNGEVDIMEYYDDKILANYAIAAKDQFNAIWDGEHITLDALGGKSWSDQFHVWTLEWNENEMTIKLDNLFINAIDLHTTINKSDGKNPFRQPHYLLLNLAMGGQRGGSLAETKLPSEYSVDYVRIYKNN